MVSMTSLAMSLLTAGPAAGPSRGSSSPSPPSVESDDERDMFIDQACGVPPMPRRFLIAERGNEARALERWKKTLAWRKELQADAMLATAHSSWKVIKQNYAHAFHERDRFGHIVYYEELAKLDMKALRLNGISRDHVLWHYTHNMEFLWNVLQPKQADKLTIVIDCKGTRLIDLGGENARFLKTTVQIMASHYPQRSFKILVLNPPSFFLGVFSMLKPLLNQATQDKIDVVPPSSTKEVLMQTIAEEALPRKYGGSSPYELGDSPAERSLRLFVEDGLTKAGIAMQDPT